MYLRRVFQTKMCSKAVEYFLYISCTVNILILVHTFSTRVLVMVGAKTTVIKIVGIVIMAITAVLVMIMIIIMVVATTVK